MLHEVPLTTVVRIVPSIYVSHRQYNVAKALWSDRVLTRVAQWVLPKRPRSTPYWLIDEKAIHKKDRHSVSLDRQYCGMTGKQDICQADVSLSVATEPA